LSKQAKAAPGVSLTALQDHKTSFSKLLHSFINILEFL